MWRIIGGLFFILTLISIRAEAADVFLKSGMVRSGTVTVRSSAWDSQLVITVQSPDKRVFQYPSKQVSQVVHQEDLLVSSPNPVYKNPSVEPPFLVVLMKGTEVVPLERRDGWVQIRCWGNREGWIEEKVLTRRVDF